MCGTFTAVQAQEDYEWDLTRPSNTGIPGEEFMEMIWAPDGQLWVSARWPFWGEAGIGVLDTQTEIWTGWNNWQHPIPSQFINDIEFDSNGVAWIATDEGLVKFDGENWETFDTSNSPLEVQKVEDISIGPDGMIWINNSSFTSFDNAIWAFDGLSEWEDFRMGDELPWGPSFNELEYVYAASDGSVYVSASSWDGFAKYDGIDWTLYGGNLDRMDQMIEDDEGNIWMVSGPSSGFYRVYKFDGTDITFDTFSDPTVTAFDDETGYLYAGFWTGEIQRTNDAGETWEELGTEFGHVQNIDPRPGSDEIWVSNYDVVFRLDADGEILERFNSNNTGMADYIVDYAIEKTPDGNIWFAAGQTGLTRFDGVKWRNWGRYNLDSEEYPFGGNTPVYNVYQDGEGDVWMASNGVARWEPETNEFTGFWNSDNSPLSIWMLYIIEDGYGNLFSFGEEGVIYRFENEEWIDNTTTYTDGIYGVEKDSQGNLWAAGEHELHFWDGNSWTTLFEDNDAIFFDLGGINCMDIDSNDVLWFGTPSGLQRWDGETFTLYDQSNSPLPANNVRGIDIRDDGLMGISAADNNPESGIALLAGDPDLEESWTVFPYSETPQPHWQVEHVAFDVNGDLWISALTMGCAVLKTGNAALEFISTTPEDQATDVPLMSAVTVTFDQDLSAYDLSGLMMTPDPGGISASVEENTLVIEHNLLDYNTTYTVFVPAYSVTNGWLPFAEDISWSFTTPLQTGIDEWTSASFIIYPNPAKNSVTFLNNYGTDGEYTIFDLNGKILQEGPLNGTEESIDVSSFSSGIYVFRGQFDDNILTQKIVIQ